MGRDAVTGTPMPEAADLPGAAESEAAALPGRSDPAEPVARREPMQRRGPLAWAQA